MNFVDLDIATTGLGAVDRRDGVDMQPEHISVTARPSILIRVSPEGETIRRNF